jgi:hypothetical protein
VCWAQRGELVWPQIPAVRQYNILNWFFWGPLGRRRERSEGAASRTNPVGPHGHVPVQPGSSRFAPPHSHSIEIAFEQKELDY